MDAFQHMDFTGTQLTIDVSRFVKEQHEAIRRVLEQHLEGAWHVTRIEEQSSTSYDATLESRTVSTPEFILMFVMATFDIQMVENGSLDRIDKQGNRVTLPRKYLYCKAQLMSTGLLRITDSNLVVPWKG